MDDPITRKYSRLLEAVLDSVESPHTRRAYKSQLTRFFEWHENHHGLEEELTKPLVLRYLRWMQSRDKSASNCNVALAAIRKLAQEASDAGIISVSCAQSLDAIKQVKKKGNPTGQWLTIEDAAKLLRGHDTSTLKGKRDRVIFALLLECGLRREEAASLQIEQIQVRDGRWVICDLLGKGGRTRTVQVPKRAYDKIANYLLAAKIKHGYLLRAINKADEIEPLYGDSMSAAAIYKRIIRYTEKVLGETYRPHDLRRSFGRLMRKHGAALDQIQQTLGHSNPRTTQIYLGEYQDLENAPCDAVDIEGYEKGKTKGQRRR